MLALLLALLTPAVHAQDDLPRYAAISASRHVGERARVCGKVMSATWVQSSKGAPTFINLDAAWPNEIFTILIWESDRSKFPVAPENDYYHKQICVTGTIEQFRGKTEIKVRDPGQIDVQGEKKPPAEPEDPFIEDLPEAEEAFVPPSSPPTPPPPAKDDVTLPPATLDLSDIEDSP